MANEEYVVLRDRSDRLIGIVEKSAAENIVETVDWMTAGASGEVPKYSTIPINEEAREILENIGVYSAGLEARTD